MNTHQDNAPPDSISAPILKPTMKPTPSSAGDRLMPKKPMVRSPKKRATVKDSGDSLSPFFYLEKFCRIVTHFLHNFFYRYFTFLIFF
jgi:hypothetical protein